VNEICARCDDERHGIICRVNRRPQLRIVAAPTASLEEAAAIVAALERFMRDTAPTPAPPPPAGMSPWAQAALLEATGHAPGEPVAWRRAAQRRSP
jgi:hypothetical protein